MGAFDQGERDAAGPHGAMRAVALALSDPDEAASVAAALEQAGFAIARAAAIEGLRAALLAPGLRPDALVLDDGFAGQEGHVPSRGVATAC